MTDLAKDYAAAIVKVDREIQHLRAEKYSDEPYACGLNAKEEARLDWLLAESAELRRFYAYLTAR